MTTQELSRTDRHFGMSFLSGRIAGLGLAAVLGLAGAASASSSKSLVALLRGGQETPPVATPARGCGRFVIDTNTNTITYRITFGGLMSPEVAAHLHVGDPGVAGPIKIALPLGNPKSGTLTYLEADEADILANRWYVNIHSMGFPAGEIRGQMSDFATNLDGAQENPAAAVTSQGWGVFRINTCTNKLDYHIVVESLGAPETAAHIHGMALIGSNVGILEPLPLGPLKTGSWIYNENMEPAILDGLLYANVHTTAFPAGEIRGQIVNTVVPIDGAQETPPNASPASGCALIAFNQATNTLGYYITYAGLGSPETAAHIHGFVPPGMAAGIVFPFPAPLSSPKKGVWAYGAANAANVFNDLSYINIHTMGFGAGEIRGQIVVALPDCVADVNCDGEADVDDVLVIINGWGPCPAPPVSCPSDTNYSGSTDVDDLLNVINGFGKCP